MALRKYFFIFKKLNIYFLTIYMILFNGILILLFLKIIYILLFNFHFIP